VTLPELALKNDGVSLALFGPGGTIISQLPGLPGKSGVSLARREPYLADESSSFALHSDPGSSPGSPNVVPE
jgi:hypothetical protein